MVAESSSPDRALAAFVAEHREVLEYYAGSEKETAAVAEAVLAWAREEGHTEAGAE